MLSGEGSFKIKNFLSFLGAKGEISVPVPPSLPLKGNVIYGWSLEMFRAGYNAIQALCFLRNSFLQVGHFRCYAFTLLELDCIELFL